MYRFTYSTGLPDVQVYPQYRFTRCTGLPTVQVYQMYRFTHSTGLPDVQVYPQYRFTHNRCDFSDDLKLLKSCEFDDINININGEPKFSQSTVTILCI